MADNALTQMSPGRQIGIAAFAFAVVMGVFYFWSYAPNAEEIAKRTTSRDTLARSVQALQVTAAKLPEFTREVAVLEAKLEALKGILPPEKETADLMRKVQSIAAQSSLSIKKFTPAATVNRDFYQEWPINMEVDGAYHNLGVFFDRVRTLSRLVNFGNMKITARQLRDTPNPSRTITASCVATTYVYVDTPPPAAAPARPGAAAPKAGK